MYKRIKKVGIAVILSGIIAFGVGCQSEVKDLGVAKVADITIMQDEYELYYNFTKGDYRRRQQELGNENVEEDWKKIKLEALEDINKGIQAEKIQLMKIEENNFVVDNEVIEENWNEILKDQGGPVKFEELLVQNYNVTQEEYKKLFGNQLKVSQFVEKQIDAVEISEDEIEAKYEEERQKSLNNATVVHILFKTIDDDNQPLSDEDQDAARLKADEILEKVKNGEDPKELALQYSQDTPGVKDNKGEYTFKDNGDMVPEFTEWAFSNEVGDSAVVKTDFGYHVMKKTDEFKDEEIEVTDEEKSVQIEQIKEGMKAKIYYDELEELTENPAYEFKKEEAYDLMIEKLD